jgi:hypothetical protein
MVEKHDTPRCFSFEKLSHRRVVENSDDLRRGLHAKGSYVRPGDGGDR